MTSTCPNPVLLFLTTNLSLTQIQHKTPHEFLKSSEGDTQVKSSLYNLLLSYHQGKIILSKFSKAVQYEQHSQVLPTTASDDRVCLSKNCFLRKRGGGRGFALTALVPGLQQTEQTSSAICFSVRVLQPLSRE